MQRNTLFVFATLSISLAACGSRSTSPTFTPITRASSAQTPPAKGDAPIEDTAASQASAAEAPVIELEPLRIQVIQDEDGAEQVIATDARGIFDEANDALAEAEFEAALKLYDELVADFAESALAVPAQFNAGLALEGLGRVDDAVGRYMQLAEAGKSSRDAVDARIRAAALYAEKQRWSAALEVLDSLLALKGLDTADRVEGMARRGFVLLEAADYSAAEKTLESTIALYDDKKKAGTVFHNDYFRAMAQFYLGDIARRQFEAIPIRLPDTQMNRDIEAKASLVLLAKARFDLAIEFGNMYWATAAGFRLAEMQQTFWSAIVGAPIPPHLSAKAAELYVQEVHRYALNMLKESLKVHGLNVQLANLYKAQSNWSEASARAVVRLTELVGREQAGELMSGKDLEEQVAGTRGQGGEYLPSRVEL